MEFLGHVVRFVVSAIAIMLVSLIVPQFDVGGFWSALLLALVIALFGWIIEAIFGKKVTPFGRGIVGFLTSALVIWLAQFVVGGRGSVHSRRHPRGAGDRDRRPVHSDGQPLQGRPQPFVTGPEYGDRP